MAKKKRHGGGKSITRELEKLGSLVALGAPAAEVFLSHRPMPINWIVARYTGYSLDQGQFQWNRLVEGWGPFVTYSLARVAAHKLLGIIRKV